jgi:hypothetical protein
MKNNPEQHVAVPNGSNKSQSHSAPSVNDADADANANANACRSAMSLSCHDKKGSEKSLKTQPLALYKPSRV